MKKQALAIFMLCLCSGVLYAGLSLGRPSAIKKRTSKLDDKVNAASVPPAAALNQAPVISSLVAVSTTVTTDGSVSLTVTATDPDSDTLTYVWTPATATFTGTGAAVSWVAPSTPGVYGVTCTVSDGKGHSANQTIQLTAKFPGEGKWVFQTGGVIVSVPAIGSDGTVYAGSLDGKLYALTPGGAQKWAFDAASPINSSPAIGADGTVYFGADDGKIHAVDGVTGLEKAGSWPYPTGGAVRSSPAIGPDGVVYAGSDIGKVYAINPDGTWKWENYLIQVSTDVHSSPALSADTVYVGAASNFLYALNMADGTLKWTYDPVGPVNSSPALDAAGNVYFGEAGGSVYSIPPGGGVGVENWFFDSPGLDAFDSSPVIDAAGVVYIGSLDSSLYAIYGGGLEKWSFLTGAAIRSSPALGADGTVFVGSDDGNLYAIDTVTDVNAGLQKWVFATSPASPIRSSPAVAPDGTVYFGADDGKLYAVCGDTPLAGSKWPKFHRDAQNTGR